MENLSLKLEQLLEDFVVDFLNKVAESHDYQEQLLLPQSFENQYRDYLERFSLLKSRIENYEATTKEEALQRNRALTLLKTSSQSIISTFHLGA
jgi:hypothetical protein